MKAFLQFISCLCLAFGLALIVAGMSFQSPSSLSEQLNRMVQPDSQPTTRETARAVCTGLGAGFATIGTLGLAVPWINALVRNRTQSPKPRHNDPPSA